MNSRRFDYTISFNADTEKVKKQLQNLQNQINSLTTQGLKQSFSMPDFSKVTKDITNLGIALKNSIDDSGKLSLTKFNQSLNTAGLTADKLKNSMAALGPAGEKAFYALTDSVLNAEVSLKRTNTLLSRFSQTLINAARWQLSSNIMHGLQSGLQQAYSYAQDLNQSLNKIRIVTGYNTDQMADFAKNANKAAKSLRASTLAYTDASLIYYQQGLTGKEITERTNATIKLSNVTGDTVETVSNQLTAVWNNFADGSKNLEYYVDVMTALGAATASSTDEIATGLEKFAAIAETTGLSYEYATSALATVTATTRQSAEVVGTAFKTLFARIQDLELGKTLEDGTSLGLYSQALATIGVNIKDQNGELKEMDQILDEIGSKWATLSKAEQASLAQTVAGTRQYTQLIALMDNWDFFKQNVNTARGSAGTLEAQAQIYAESWEAASKKVRASAEEIYSSLIDDKFFIKLTNFFSDALNVLDNIIDGVGGLKGILAIVSTILMKTFSKQMTKNFTAFGRNMALAGEGLKNGKTFGEKIKGGWKGITGRAAEEQGIAQREKFLDAAILLRTRKGTGAEDALNDIYLQRYDIQQKILKDGENLTAEQQEYLKILQEQLQVIGQQYEKELDRQKVLDSEENAILAGLSDNNKQDYNKLRTALNTSQVYRDAGNILDNFNKKRAEIKSDGTLTEDQKIKEINNLAEEFKIALQKLIDSTENVPIYDEIGKKLSSDIENGNFIEKFREGSLQKGSFASAVEDENTFIKLAKQTLPKDIVDLAVKRSISDAKTQWAREQGAEAREYARKTAKKIADEEGKIATEKDFGRAASAVSMSLMSLSAAFSSAESVISTWNDETKSFSEKLTSTTSSLTTMGFSVTQAGSQLKNLGLSTKQSITAIVALLALIGSIRFVGFAIDKAQERNPEKKIQKAREEYEKNKEVLQENINAYDDLNKSIESLGDQADSINKLAKGTTDWYLAISKSNNQLVELLKTYKLLNKEYYKIDNDGLYSLTEKGETALKGAAFKQAQTAQQSMALNEIALSQQVQAANNQAFAKNNDIATTLQRSSTFAAGTASAAATGLGIWGGAKLGALAGGAVTAATAGGAGAAAGAAFGSIVPVIGTLIGAALGLGIGIISTTKVIEDNNQKLGNFAEQVADTMNETGATLEDDKFAEKMRSLGYTVDETTETYLKEIQTNKKARDAMNEFAASVAQTKAQQDMYWQQLAENNLQSDSYYNSLNTDTEKSDYVKITAQALKAAAETAYDETYKDKGGGIIDEEIQKTYAKAIGWTFVKDLGGNMGRYMDNEGKEVEVSDEVARRYLASIDKNTQYQAKEIARNIKNLETKAKEDNNVSAKLLYNIASGQGIDGLTKSDIDLLANKDVKDILKDLGITENQLEDLYGITIEELEKGLKQSINAFDEIYLAEQSLPIPEDWTYRIAQNFSDQFRAVEDVWGNKKAKEWYDQAVNLRNKLVEAAGGDEDLLTKINNLDFSKLNIFDKNFDDLVTNLFGSNPDSSVSKWIENLEKLSIVTSDELSTIVNSYIKAINKIKNLNLGDTIEEAIYNALPPSIQKKFAKNQDGSYSKIGIITQQELEESEKESAKNYVQGQRARKSQAIIMQKEAQDVIDSYKIPEGQSADEYFSNYEIEENENPLLHIKSSTFSEQGWNSFVSYLQAKGHYGQWNGLKWKPGNITSLFDQGISKVNGKIIASYTGADVDNGKEPYIKEWIQKWQAEGSNNKQKYFQAVEDVNTAQNILDSPIDMSSISSVTGLTAFTDELKKEVDEEGNRIYTDEEIKTASKNGIISIIANSKDKYKEIQASGLLNNIEENYDKIIEKMLEIDNIEKQSKFVDTISQTYEELNKVDKGSNEWKNSLMDLSIYLQSIGINLTWEQLGDYPKLLDSLKKAASGSAEAVKEFKLQLVQMSMIDLFSRNGMVGSIRDAIVQSFLTGEENISIKYSQQLINLFNPLISALGGRIDNEGIIRWPSDTDFTGNETDIDKLNTEIDKLNSRRSALQSRMEHAYDEARRDMEKQEINLVDQLIAKQKALLAITTDAAQRESILAEIESLRNERESLELEAIKNKYKEIEQLLKNQKSLYEDLADIKKAQDATNLEQLQSEIEGLNFVLTDIILAGKNFEEARTYYENHQKDRHAIEQYQEAIVNLSSVQAAFWKTRESITSEINSILDKSDEKINNYIDGLDHIAEGFKNLNDILKSSTFFLSLDEKVLKNINNLTKEANKLTLDNNKNILTARIAERKTYQKEIEKLKRDLADPTLAAENRIMYEELLPKAEEKLQSVEDSIQTTWKDSLDLINSIFEESIDEAIKDFEDSVSSYSSLDNLKKAFDFQKEESDQVLDSVTQTYELSKLSRTIAQEIGNKTSLKAQNSLKNLLEEINQIQKDKTQLSEQELKNLQQRYDLRLAEIALEEAQWNKTQMRLQRNANGTWSYTYGSTNEDLIKAQQNLEDKQQEIYKTNSEMVDSMSEKLISSLQSYSSGMQDIAKKVASGEMTTEQAREARQLNQKYLEQANNYAKRLEKALNYANINYADTDLAKATSTKTLAGLMSNITSAANKLDADTSNALNNLAVQTKDLFQTIGFEATNAFQILNQAQADSTEKTKDINKAVGDLDTTMDGLNIKINNFRNMWANMSGYIAKSFETIDQLIERLEKIGKSLAGFGDFNADSISKDNSNKSKSKIFTSKEYTDTDYYRQAEEALARNDITAAEEAVRKRNEKIDRLGLGEEAKLTVDEIRKGIRKGQKYDTGGYTGDWGSDGKLAVLHEKELVLNKEDTANILNAVNAVRSLSSSILKDIFANSGFLMDLLSGMSSAPSINPNSQLEQNVRIEASFPNVSSKDEIEAAFTDLVNQAAQFASIKNL